MPKPNIIMIMTDQQRFDAMGCVNAAVITPAIDSLAARGILYDQAVCQCPMCVPSRNSMMFGMYPSQTGVRSNAGALLDESRLPAVPLPQLLADAGYFCAGFGKTHWNHCRKGEEGSPRGFSVRAEGQPRGSLATEKGMVMMSDEDPEGLKAYFDETREFGGGEENYHGYLGKISTLAPEHHKDGFITRKCLEFLDSYRPREEQPLFLYYSLIKPHAGFNIPSQFEDMYRPEDIPDLPLPPWEDEPDTHIAAAMRVSQSLHDVHYSRKEKLAGLSEKEKKHIRLRYYANCTFMDYFIGQVLDKIKEKGLDKNTLFVFLSDHGDMMGERDDRYSKYCLFDSSVRVPLILAGDYIPKDRQGTLDSRPAMLTDIVPTLAAAGNAQKDPRLPGLNLLGDKQHSGAFCEFHGGGLEPVQPAPAWMWRTQDYKLILFREGDVTEESSPKGELYDLRNDPWEWNNLYNDPSYAEIRFRMMTELISHIASSFAKGPAHGHFRGLEPLRK